MKRTLQIIIVLLTIVFCFCLVAFAFSDPKQADYSDRYNQSPRAATSVRIYDKVNLRSEPIVNDDISDGTSNSFGTKKTSETFELEVSEIIWEESSKYGGGPLDVRNGYFIGIHVDDITAVDGWTKIFPKSITKDPDGIVWINYNYITVNYEK